MARLARRKRQRSGDDRARDGLSAVAVATFLSLIGASAAGCHSGIQLRPDQLQQLAAYPGDGAVKITADGGDKAVVEAARTPQLVLLGPSEPVVQDGAWMGGYSDLILRAPLERFRFEPARVVLLAAGPPGEASAAGLKYRGRQGDYDVPLSAIKGAEIVLGPPLTEPWEPRWGVGASIAGPSRLLAANLELRFLRHLAIEAGLFSLGPGFIAWAGAKVISPRVHRVALFAGGYVGAMGGGDASSEEAARAKNGGGVTYHGVRLGLEWMFRSWADAISLEVDFFRQQSDPPSTDSFLGCRDGQRCPFGGASYVHFF